MGRRCKQGQRARIVDGGVNDGVVVVITGPYFGGVFDNAVWPFVLFGWIVTSLGRDLQSRDVDTGEPKPGRRTIPYDDRYLEPIDDDQLGNTDEIERDRPTGSRQTEREIAHG